jgi:ATP-binding cassette subfamily B (MDR/TAP) protein 1
VCLARALVGDPALLVLDEATSALDTISEASILKSLAKSRSGNRTTIMIAHRLASIKDADHIIVMGKSRVLEEGDHQSLLDSEGEYRKLIDAQRLGRDDTHESTEIKEDSASIMTKVSDQSAEEVRPAFSQPSSVSAEPPSFSSFAIVRRCLALGQSRSILTLFALLGSILTGGLILGESVIFGHLVQLLNGDMIPSGKVDFFCLMFFVVALVALIGYVTSGSCFGIVSEYLVFRVRDVSLQTILRQDMEWFLQPGRSTSSLVSVISMDSGHISGLSGVIIGTIVSALVSVVGGAILAHVVAWKIAIVLFATSPVILLSGFFRLRVVGIVEESNSKAYTEAASLATEACGAIRTIAALGTEKVTLDRFRQAIQKNQKRTSRDTALGNMILAFALSITYFVYSLAYWWGSKLVRSGEYSSLQFFIVLPAILFSAQAAGQIFSLAPDIGRAKGAASRVFNLHDQKPSIDTKSSDDICPASEKSVYSPQSLPRTDLSSVPLGTIAFKDVGLTYASRPSDPVFTNFNLTIHAGETVALVGRSGAGKTSIISLIERFYDPTAGTILLDGVDIRSVPVSQHRARISLVSQDPDLFAGTVAFNVGLGARPGHTVTREEVVEACKAVGIHEFVSSLPDGYETYVSPLLVPIII